MRALLPVTLVLFAFALRPEPAEAEERPVLTLAQAFEHALRHNDDLESIRAAVARARAGRRRALAALLPALTAGGSYTLNDQEVVLGGSAVVNRHQFSGVMTLNLGLFDGRAFPTFRSAGQLIDVASMRHEDAREAILAEVGRAYYTVLAAEEMVGVAGRAVEARKRHLLAVRALLEAGHAVRLDIERGTAALHQAERELIDARFQAFAARDGLAMAIGRDPPLAERLVRAPAAVGPTVSTSVAMQRAQKRRRDLAALAGELDVAERTRFGTWLSFLPQLSATGRINVAQESFSNPDGISMTLTLNLTWALYDGGARYAQLADDAGAIRQARAALSKASRRVRADVLDAIRGVERAGASLKVTAAQQRAARRALEAAEAGFKLRTATGLDVLDAQLALEQADAAHIREELQQQIARLRLRRALGDPIGDRKSTP